MKGKFIVIEGIDGCGKTTQIDELSKWLPNSGLIRKGSKLITTREPGGSMLGKKLRGLILDNNANNKPSSLTELLLYSADRAEHVSKIISPALRNNDWVISDRFSASTMAYQGYGRELSKEFISSLISFTKCPIPNFTFLLDIPVEEGFGRKHNDTMDRIESSGFEFFDKVRKGYLEIASNNDDRFIVINANNEIDSIHDEILFNLNIK